jgi:DNA-binding NarL/FixJ family response regulator
MDGSKRLLLVAAGAADAIAVGAALAPQAPGQAFALEVIHVTHPDAAAKALRESDFAAILLDIATCPGGAAEAVRPLLESAPDTPLLVIADSHTASTAIDAVHHGAQDLIL